MEPLILFGIILALGLAFVNGLNDASHSIATVVATRALSPAKAVFLTAICNMIGPFIFTTAVAATIGTTIVTKSALTPTSIIVAMAAAILLIFVATRIGIPLSSSNAMVGGLMGAGVAVGGIGAILLPGTGTVLHVIFYGLAGGVAGALILAGLTYMLGADVRLGALLGTICGAALIIPILMVAGVLKLSGLLVVVMFIFISPILGMVSAFLFDIVITHLFRHSRQNRMKRIFQPFHIFACLLQAAAHGGNDGQNAVGLITALLVASGILASFAVPLWVILAAALAIGLGTCFGGWQVVEKMAHGITKIRPYQGFCAATASSGTLVMETLYGIPVSSTHAINGAIVGVGATRGKDAVQWRVVREMMTAWIITIPLAFVCAFAGYLAFSTVIFILGSI
ncbi:anion permease [Methanoregula sp.]|jgi:PiT family inorganic phosphate transporter|uniref:inorganic phosphate transporter n=1 Tax=Methanoregula sp. TaxID=2052170 RepID=UPI003C262708